ncbi:MAG: BREX-1 system phosphatase PglZ type A [Lactobacillus sp.]|nr:BREX-1 system phosphatase PglZ type A [Lactobacillus sp.]
MAELNVNKIITKLNQAFEQQRLIFWYDSDAEFADNMDVISQGLDAEVILMAEREQFKTKLFLENHPNTKYLIYATFARPDIENNFLTDVEEYSLIFTADVYQLLLQELNLPTNQLPFIKEHFKFFGNKSRVARFKKHLNNTVINHPELGIIASILRVDQIQVNAFLKKVLAAGIDNNSFLAEFDKYNVLDYFWQLINQEFGFVPSDNNLVDLVCALYINYTYSQMELDLPQAFDNYKMDHLTNVATFMSSFADSAASQNIFDELSDFVWQKLNLAKFLQKIHMENLLQLNFYAGVDRLILLWIKRRVLVGDLNSLVGEQDLLTICQERQKRTREVRFKAQYRLLTLAIYILKQKFVPYESTAEAIDKYLQTDYQIDSWYRYFIATYQKVGDPNSYKELKEQVSQFYLTRYLNESIKSWNNSFSYRDSQGKHQQSNFYHNYIRPQKDRVVVIISDALRFEIAKELQSTLDQDDRIQMNMDYLISTLPSVTYLGMSALLPHKSLELTDDLNILVDNKLVDTRQKRAQVLKNYNADSEAFGLDELLKCTSAELRTKFVGKKVIYIYHNQIDAIGDNAKTEDEVFNAAQQAINELKQLINALRTINVSHVLVTADHGFVYRDSQILESDKIDLNLTNPLTKKSRYALAKEKIEEMGVAVLSLGEILQNNDERWIYYPKSANVFKTVGSQNYVHGGSSLQEMLLPVLDIKMSSSRSQAQYVELKLGNTNHRVTALEVTLPFIQTAPISDTVLASEFKIYFVDELNQIISTEAHLLVDNQDSRIESRMYRLKLSIKNQSYDRQKDYRLVIENITAGTKEFETFQMDLIISNDFGFDF